MSLIDIIQPTLITPLRVMVDAEDGRNVVCVSLIDDEGREWLHYAFPVISGYQHLYTPEEKIIISAPINLGPLHTCGYTQVTTIDAAENRSLRYWKFPRRKEAKV